MTRTCGSPQPTRLSVSRAAFVTGGTGFVGLNLVQQLMAGGLDVTALHRPIDIDTAVEGIGRAMRFHSIQQPAARAS